MTRNPIVARGARLALAFAAALLLSSPRMALGREEEPKLKLTNWVGEGVFICESICPTIGPLGPQCCQVFQL